MDVYRHHSERYVANSDRFGGGSVMVLAGIHHDGRTSFYVLMERLILKYIWMKYCSTN